MLVRILILLAALWGLTAAPAQAAPFRSERVELELVPMAATAAPGSTVHVALSIRLAPGWHTYWKNAGDAGLPAEIAWTLPSGWSAGAIVWPRPSLMPEGPLMTYGWEGEVLLPVPVTVPASARPGETATLKARATVLVCDDICVPETAELSVAVPVGEAITLDPRHGPAIARTVAAAPRPAGIRAVAALENGVLKIAALDGPLVGAGADEAYFFADRPGLVAHAAPQTIERGPRGLTLSLTPGKNLGSPLQGPVTGLLATKDGAWPIEAVPGDLPAEAAGLGAAKPLTVAVEPEAGGAAPPAPKALGLPLAILLALLGGLILNLMPCVFPVLAMKAAALASHAHAPAEARRDGLAFTAGVLTAFVVLALALLAAKAAGEAAGWGFQLQSPWTTGTLALVMLAVGLNLSGVFHVGMSLQGAGALNRYGGLLGAFLTGALAVVVAAPCFAPFMTEAVGYGLTHSALEAVVVFLTLGLGFALPYLALSLSPALARRLPRPGPWMNTLKSLLAFPMYAAAAWLVWVFAQQTGSGALGLMLAAAVLMALAFFLAGRVQEAQAVGRPSVVVLAGAGLALMAAVILAVTAAGSPAPAAGSGAGPESLGEISAEPWSAGRVAALRAEGRPVFVNFTAAWCVTCKVNERGALNGRRTRDAFERTRAAYLVADWTRRDETIARELARHGRSGVPLYLVYRPGEAEPLALPQLLTEGAVVEALE